MHQYHPLKTSFSDLILIFQLTFSHHLAFVYSALVNFLSHPSNLTTLSNPLYRLLKGSHFSSVNKGDSFQTFKVYNLDWTHHISVVPIFSHNKLLRYHTFAELILHF